jgi:hypothetical protein
MKYLFLLEVDERSHKLLRVKLHLKSVESLTQLKKTFYRALCTQFKYDVNIVFVFEEMDEAANIGTLETSMDFYFVH